MIRDVCVFYLSSAEPMKKKKKVDMSIVITREQRKMRKLEKAIRKQEAKGRTLKPIDEIEGDRSFLKTLESVTILSDLCFYTMLSAAEKNSLFLCEYLAKFMEF